MNATRSSSLLVAIALLATTLATTVAATVAAPPAHAQTTTCPSGQALVGQVCLTLVVPNPQPQPQPQPPTNPVIPVVDPNPQPGQPGQPGPGGPTCVYFPATPGPNEVLCQGPALPPAPPPPPPPPPPPSIADTVLTTQAQLDFPTVSPDPTGLPGAILAAGYEHSLVLNGYESWDVRTVTVSLVGGLYSATLTGTPTKVTWNLGSVNAAAGHGPTTIECDGPGDGGFSSGIREFQDFQTYSASNYGGADCIYVWWGLSADHGSVATITATIEWDMVLTVSWQGGIADQYTHTEDYASPTTWWLDAPSAVNTLQGASETSTANG